MPNKRKIELEDQLFVTGWVKNVQKSQLSASEMVKNSKILWKIMWKIVKLRLGLRLIYSKTSWLRLNYVWLYFD